MSWGKIYCNTWFGDYENIRHSIDIAPDCTYYPYIADYYARVITDGGVVESARCVAEELQTLKEI